MTATPATSEFCDARLRLEMDESANGITFVGAYIQPVDPSSGVTYFLTAEGQDEAAVLEAMRVLILKHYQRPLNMTVKVRFFGFLRPQA